MSIASNHVPDVSMDRDMNPMVPDALLSHRRLQDYFQAPVPEA